MIGGGGGGGPVICAPTAALRSRLPLHSLTGQSAELAKQHGGSFMNFYLSLVSVPMEVDAQLVDLINSAVEKNKNLKPADYELPSGVGSGEGSGSKSSGGRNSFLAYPMLRRVSPSTLSVRLAVVKNLNRCVETAIPLIDLRLGAAATDGGGSGGGGGDGGDGGSGGGGGGGSSDSSTLARSLCESNGVIFLKTKMEIWTKALSDTASGNGVDDITINRVVAAEMYHRRSGSDRVLQNSVFGQIFQQVQPKPPARLRITASGRAWRVNFVGEGAIDAGGPYRESLSDMTKELWMPHLALFVPCSNRRAELEGFVDGMAGIHNMDKFVPNPVRRSPYHLELYAFVGKLLGLAMRASLALPFHLPGLVFKRVLGQAVTKVDLKLVDKFLVDYLDNVSNAHLDPNMTAELFGDLYGDRSFTTKTIDGREVELVPGGRRIFLSLGNSRRFVERMLAYHCAEFDAQCAAIARGLATIVPINILRLFTAQQCELLVVGHSEVDLALLRRKTTYDSPYSNDHPTIVLFWAMMEAFSNEERQMMIKFAWSRDRLPLNEADFSSNFKITRLHCRGDPNQAFPQAHTCFFTVDLPEYTNLEDMTSRIRYAIENCTAIDTDNQGGEFDMGNIADDDDEDDDDDEEDDDDNDGDASGSGDF